MRRPAFTTPRRARALWPVLACLLIVFVYYIVPLAADRTLPFRILGALAAIVALGTVALRQLTSAEQRVGRLVTLPVLVVVCCSAAFYSLASTPGQMEGLVTRTDALYFTVITTATIGYGDIYPVGQAARGLVIVTVAFNAVFVAAIGSAIIKGLNPRSRAAAGADAARGSGPDPGERSRG